MLKNPEKTLEEFNTAAQTVQHHVLAELNGDLNVSQLSVKTHVHCRVHALPICPELHRNLLPGNQDMGMFLQITGTTTKCSFKKY